METKAKNPEGGTYEVGDGAEAEAFTLIGEVTSLPFPVLTRMEEETTHHGSQGKTEEWSPTWFSAPELSMTIAYVEGDDDVAALEALLTSGAKTTHRITVNGFKYEFQAFVKSVAPDVSNVKALTYADVSIRVTGPIVKSAVA